VTLMWILRVCGAPAGRDGTGPYDVETRLGRG
jgi:hypothetical protein